MNETVNQLENMEEQESSIDFGKLYQDLLKYKKVYYKDAQTERFAFILMEYGRSVSRIVPGAAPSHWMS